MAASARPRLLAPILTYRLRRQGIVYPAATIRAAHTAKLGLPLACALLMQESAGGQNVFGHDPTIFVGAGTVTRAKYLAYAHLRDLTGACQGVGPCQLTSAGYQRQADEFGGCWNPLHNMAVGFHAMHGLIERYGTHGGVRAYNGSGRAAETYAQQVIGQASRFQRYGVPGPIGITG